MTVAEALKNIHIRSWVLPAIQREFVWGSDQICVLFDSLMRGYPVGSFLLWNVVPEQAAQFTFYDFLADYHEKNPYARVAQISAGRNVTAVLDGQQRFTSLNIGLYGSYAERLPRKWAANPDAYPRKRLYLNLLSRTGDEELGLTYDLQFLTEQEAESELDGQCPWFKVADILQLENSGPAMMAALEQHRLSGSQPFNTLYNLYEGVRTKTAINAYLEESTDADRVLDIFVRVNSGGTKLSNSDLLLSMATNQWRELDAREEIRSLVTELNQEQGRPFAFSKDLVLKAGLVLTEAPDFRFKISNFTQANMERLEKAWPQMRASLLRSARLLATFGLSERTLTADSVVIPLAYYLHSHGHDDAYIVSSAHSKDREAVRSWVFRSLLKRGVWGSGLDTLLNRICTVIRQSPPSDGFPAADIESAMAARGKSLQFGPEEVEELLDLQYSKARTFAVLALLYPGLNLSQDVHEDHIFPRSRFRRSALTRMGIPAEKIEEYLVRANGLPNLQLLAGTPNVEKSDAWPWEWLGGPHFPTVQTREEYVTRNDLDLLPSEPVGFLDFYEGRRLRMRERLLSVLGESVASTDALGE
ncbi:DUF262 domain-containing protein [Streptomyces sp. NPDC058469]|uniref:DUF262 domain-containing protein n=1 Tax=Streptomyces sp. NPDC058469 TaxID=3346514 RepID=UPI0036645C1B